MEIRRRSVNHQASPLDPDSLTPSRIVVRKSLTNSKSIIKRRPRLGQMPLAESNATGSAASASAAAAAGGGIRIGKKKLLTKSSSIIRPVVVRSRFTKCSLNPSVENDATHFGNATCASKFRSTAFPDDHGDHEALSNKVCTYTYCSIHGAGRPQLKRFVSIRSRPVVSRKTNNSKRIQSKKAIQLPKDNNAEHMEAAKSPMLNNNNAQIEDTPVLGTPRNMDRAKWRITNQHQPLFDNQSNISEAPEVTKDEKPREENEKTTRVWRLIYHSMLSAKYRSELYPPSQVSTDNKPQGISAPVQENNSEVEGADTLAVTQTFESSQMDAVKLVEDAIDELFLPEVEEQLSNNQTMMSNGVSENDVQEGKLIDISNHFPIDSVKEVKPFSKLGSESMSKNWSKLKQIVLLKRFVKALDKLSDLQFKEPNFLNVNADPEMEKVRLRHQTTDEKRLADEWMLDYALRQAVAKLTPARRKKVELLIEAFETVIPLSNNGTSHGLHQSSSGRLFPEKNQPSSVPSKEIVREGTNPTIAIEQTAQRPFLVSAKETNELGVAAGSMLSRDHPPLPVHSQKHTFTEVASSVLNKFVSNTQTFRNLEHNLNDQSSTDTGLIGHNDAVHIDQTEMKSIPSPVRSFDSRYENSEVAKMTKIASASNSETIQEEPLRSNSAKQRDFDVQLNNQKYFKMWGMIYNHVVSGTAAKIGNELHIIESTDSREAAGSKLDAVKLVEDALDEMLLPEYQDQSDDQSITSDQDHLERMDSESLDSETSTPKDSVSFYFKDVNQMKAKSSSDACEKARDATHTQESNMADKGVSKINRLKSNGWSNLKRFILLKRFIRALDKLKKLNPRQPNYLSLEPDQEPEKVTLKRQTTDERLSAEQWMIDNAIQQVVARLTPARKRRVELLVEAFETVETVLPTPRVRTPLKHSWPSSVHAKHL